MKALSVTQPHAQLIALLMKLIETRSWATSYRGQLAIHAAKGLGPVGGKRGLLDLCGEQPFFGALYPIVPGADRYCDKEAIADALPLGAIVAVCDLVACRPATELGNGFFSGPRSIETGMVRLWKLTDQERAFGDYSPGRFAWLLDNIRALPEPVPAKGQLGLWQLDTPTEMAVTRQLIRDAV